MPGHRWLLTVLAIAWVGPAAPPVIQNVSVPEAEKKTDYFASPDGKGAACSKELPCSLGVALSGSRSPVHPGDTLWLRGGIYRGAFKSSLRGFVNSPVIVRQMPGERAVLDGGDSKGSAILTIAGGYTWYWDFEIMSSDPTRVSSQVSSWPTDIPRGEGVAFQQVGGAGVGTKLINLVIHDTRQGVSFWKQAQDAEIYGCIIFNNGWDGPANDRGHGHGIYVQNRYRVKRISNNIIFHQFSHGIHAYGSESAPLDNISVEENILFDNGVPSAFGLERNVLIGGAAVAHNIVFLGNYAYGGKTKFGYSAPVNGLTMKKNYLPTTLEMNAIEARIEENTLLAGALDGFKPAEYPQNTYLTAEPTGLRVFLQPNTYELGRANLVVYNWDRKRSIPVDLSPLLRIGDPFEIWDAQDFLGSPIATGIYKGNPIAIDLASAFEVTQPIGSTRKVPHTDMNFAAFVIMSGPNRRVLSSAGSSQSVRPAATSPAPFE